MNIIEQIKEVAADEHHFSRTGLCESGFDVDEMLALAESHERLLEVARFHVEKQDQLWDLAVSTCDYDDLKEAVTEAEKIYAN